ncbi:MAG: hypothetical protein MZV70_54540 [Desulfobacterales bacterium]|nr:hypothetical protein [Desulfobacterales bacterium]
MGDKVSLDYVGIHNEEDVLCMPPVLGGLGAVLQGRPDERVTVDTTLLEARKKGSPRTAPTRSPQREAAARQASDAQGAEGASRRSPGHV